MRGDAFSHQHLVLSHRARKQRADQPRVLDEPRRARDRAERQQPGQRLRQKRQMVIGLAGALERDAQQRGRIGGKRRRQDRVALDDAGIAERGLFAHAGAIEQRDAQAALGEMQRDRSADNAGAEHDCIGAGHGYPSPSSFTWQPHLYGMDRAPAL
jgi:hypothetical protein